MLPPNPGELHMTQLFKSVHAHSPAFCFNHPKWEPRFETLGEIQLRKGIKCDFTLTGSLDITLPCGFSCALNKDSEAMLGAGAQVSVPALQGPGQGAQPALSLHPSKGSTWELFLPTSLLYKLLTAYLPPQNTSNPQPSSAGHQPEQRLKLQLTC